MRTLIVLLFVTLAATVFGQAREATILFNDSTSVKGFAEIKKEKIYFKASPDSEVTEWSFDMAYGLVFSGYGYSEKYVYVYPGKKAKKPILMLVVEENFVSLYKKISFTAETVYPMNWPLQNPGQNATIKHYDSTVYYAQRKNETTATDITSNFKTDAAIYFTDCEALVAKIKKKEFKKEDVLDVVDYYNDYCGDEAED